MLLDTLPIFCGQQNEQNNEPGISEFAMATFSTERLATTDATIHGAIPPLPARLRMIVNGALRDVRNGATKLDLTSKRLGDAGVAVLARGLREEAEESAKITLLMLECNEITDYGACALAAVLPVCAALTTVFLSDNDIGNAGVSAICAALPRCPALVKLFLDGNNIGNDGAAALAAIADRQSAANGAAKGGNATPASPWTTHIDKATGNTYYANKGTGRVTWTPRKSSYRGNGEEEEEDVGEEKANGYWSSITDKASGRQYFSNAFTGRVTWTPQAGARAWTAHQGSTAAVVGTTNTPISASNGMPACATLAVLGLNDNEIGDVGVEALAEALPRCPALTALYLGDNQIGARGASALAVALPQCMALRELTLCSNRLGAAGAAVLSKALPPALQSLGLEYNKIGDAGACAVAATLPNYKALADLSLSDNDIGDEGAIALSASFVHCHALVALYLGGNRIKAPGAAALGTMLPKLTELTTLFLSDNQIADAGAKAVATALPTCPVLDHLGLECNHIGDDGARALASAFPKCPALTWLSLADNSIGDAGAEALTSAIPKFWYVALSVLYLNGNQIGDAGALALARSLAKLSAVGLKKLVIDRNRIGRSGAHALAAAFAACIRGGAASMELDYEDDMGRGGDGGLNGTHGATEKASVRGCGGEEDVAEETEVACGSTDLGHDDPSAFFSDARYDACDLDKRGIFAADAAITVIFSGRVSKINKRKKRQDRVFVCTATHFYNMCPKRQSGAARCLRKIPLSDIGSVFVNRGHSMVLIRVEGSYDYIFTADKAVVDAFACLVCRAAKGRTTYEQRSEEDLWPMAMKKRGRFSL